MTVMLIGKLDALDAQTADYLREDGIELVQTDDTQAGIEDGLQHEPKLAFVEVDSPANDNFEALAQLRKEGLPSFRIVAVCNRYSPHINRLCAALGADFTIPQTDDRSNLVLLIRGLMVLNPNENAFSRRPGTDTGNPTHTGGTAKAY